jgi:hypothetical protein
MNNLIIKFISIFDLIFFTNTTTLDGMTFTLKRRNIYILNTYTS